MRFLRWLFVLARICAIAFFLLSSLWALLAYIPFTYQQVHTGGLLPWLNVFGRLQSKIYWAALGIALATLAPDFRRRQTRRRSGFRRRRPRRACSCSSSR